MWHALGRYFGFLLVVLTIPTQLHAASVMTTTKLTILPGGPVSEGTVVTFVATVESGGAAVTPGIVYFCNATVNTCFTGEGFYGVAQLTAAGTATMRTRLNVGSNDVVAIFIATKGSLGSKSAAAIVTVGGKSIYPTVTSLVSSGGPGNYTLTGSVSSFGKEQLGGTINLLDTSYNNAEIGSAILTNQSIGLSSPVPYGVGHQPTSVVTGDLNGDGITDLIVANENDNNISVLLGNGDGTFQKEATFATGHTPESIAVGDFNGDSIQDIAVANTNANSISILLGNGDGSFQPQRTLAAGVGPVSIASADLNNDGKIDLVVANVTEADVSILLGNGDGSFQAAISSSTGLSPQSVAAGDLNSDGIIDLVIANNYDDTISVLLGKGDGTFQSQTKLATGVGPFSLTMADLNDDGVLDIAVANRNGNSISILIGNGNGTFQTQVLVPTGTAPDAVVVGDFNGDGIPDLAVSDQFDSNVSIIPGSGNGTFSHPQAYLMGSFTGSLATGDFNGDGITDLANTDLTELNVQLGRQTANFSVSGISGLGSQTNWVLADYPGDDIRTPSQSSAVPLSGTPGTPVVSLFAAPNPASFGTVVTLSATITGGDVVTPTGEIIFKDGTTVLGSATISGTTATVVTSNLAVGIHYITAVYNGDQNYSAASSHPLPQTITRAAVTISLKSSTNPSIYGNTLTITATLEKGPTGTVTFLDGENALGASVVSPSGDATISTAALAAGLHTITAIYSGDENFQ
jgi:hypothetical protein